MSDLIVSSNHMICLVGGARVDRDTLTFVQTFATDFVGVDSGADVLWAANVTPMAVIGDLDSISDVARERFASVIHHFPEQDTTDFEKALSRVQAPVTLAVGFTGGRMDHSLAALNVLARYLDRGVILMDADEICFMAPQGKTLFEVPPETPFSLMPLGKCQVTVTGLKWSFERTLMEPDGFISSSNQAMGPVTVDAEGPVMITLPVAYFQHVLPDVVRGQ